MAFDVYLEPTGRPEARTHLRSYDERPPALKCAGERAFPGLTALVIDSATGEIVFTTEIKK